MNHLIQLELGPETIYIQTTLDGEEVQIFDASGQPNVTRTGVHDQFEKVYEKAKTAILAMAMDLGRDIGKLPTENSPKQVDVEFSLGFSAQANAWVIGTKSESAFKIKFSWTQ